MFHVKSGVLDNSLVNFLKGCPKKSEKKGFQVTNDKLSQIRKKSITNSFLSVTLTNDSQ